MFDADIDIQFPSYCGDILACKNQFRQQAFAKFSSPASFFLSIPLIDGQVLGFEASLASIFQNSGEYDYASDVYSLGKEIQTKDIRSYKIVEKPLILFS
jgi:hypothetical protein